MTTCPRGSIRRKSYTRRSTGKRVSAKCIKAQSQSGRKRSVEDRKYLSRRKSIQRKASKKFGTPKCGKGEIVREGYRRTSRGKAVWVPPTCIKDVGNPGHGTQLFRLEKDVLAKFGYEDVKSMSEKARHTALNKALKELKPLSLYRRLVALSTLNKNTNASLSRLFKNDAEWLKSTPAYQDR
jgi:hypothetical protein